jgi:hypothetical protein
MKHTQIAINLARNNGYHVFPCRSDNKRPMTQHGFYDASADPDVVAALFASKPDALIGIRTGEASGISVLDIDIKHDAACAWWRRYERHIPATRIYRTRSGGIHCYFQHAPQVKNSEGKPIDGVDVRGQGGYIIYWFAEGFECLDHAPPAPWPRWLSHVFWPERLPISRASANHGALSEQALERTRQNAIQKVREAGDGSLHNRIRASARLLGGIQTQAGFSDNDAIGWLMDASGLGREAKAEKTVLWGLERGRGLPLVEER